MTTPSRQAVFRNDVYEVDTLEKAKAITVTPEAGTTTEERWEKETTFLSKHIGGQLGLSAEDCVFGLRVRYR